MDNDIFGVPIDMACQNHIITSGNFSHSTSVSLVHSNSHDLNEQNQIMAGFPALSIMQDEQLNHLHGGCHLTNHAGIASSSALVPRSSHLEKIAVGDTSIGTSCPISNIEVQDRFMAGMPISAASLANLLAARYGPHENLNEIETSAPSAHPKEVLRTFVSNDYSDTMNSSLGNFVNYGYNGLFGDMSSKWNIQKISAPQLAGTVPQRTGLLPFQIMGNMDQNEWISSENTGMSSDSISGSSRYSNEPSPVLSTCQPSAIYGTTIREHCSEISGSSLSSHSFHEKRLGSGQTSCNSKNLSLSFGYKPVQFSQLLSGSRFLNEMQEILAEFASSTLGNSVHLSYPISGTRAAEKFSFSSSQPAGSCMAIGPDNPPDSVDPMLCRREVEAKKKHLLDLLQMVDNQYNQCLDDIHKVISAFHAVTELDPHIHARFALQTISLLYKSLRERISKYILVMGAHLEGGTREEERSFEKSFIQKQWALQQLRSKEHQLWRPQRGLPERSVSVLRAWMFQNFLHPYPKDAEKQLLAVKSGLTRSQVSNWFINARVRLWKPMIDEMYSEMNRRKARRNGEETYSQHRNLIASTAKDLE